MPSVFAVLATALVMSGCAAKKLAKEAESMLADGRTTHAARCYQQACDKRPTKGAFQLGWARALLADGQADRAVAPARAAYSAEEEGADLVLVDALLRVGGLDEALELLSDTPDLPAYLELEARAFLVAGDAARAVEVMQRGVAAESSAARQAYLGWLLVRAGEIPQAVGAAQLASDANSDDLDALGDIAAVFLVTERVAERKNAARDVQSFGTDVLERWKAQAGRSQQAGDMEGALRFMTRAVALRADDGELNGLLGTMFLAIGEYALAIRFLEGALHAETYCTSWERAEGFVEAGAVHTMGFENEQAASFGRALAGAHEASGHALLAAQNLRSALLVGGDNTADAWLEVATLFHKGGNLKGAAHAVHYAQKMDTRHLGALVMLTNLYLAVGDSGQAIGYGRMAWSVAPGDPRIALTLGQLYEQRGEPISARELYLVALEKYPDVIELRAALKRIER